MAKKRPNIVDIIIIIVVIAVCALGVYKFTVVNHRETTSIEEESEEREYTAYIDEVRMATVNALHKGDLMFDEKTGICIGEITEVSYEPFIKNVLLPDGSTKAAKFPDYYSVTLKLKGDILEKEDAYFVGGTVELKANSEMNVYTKYAKPVIKVTEISD